MSAKKKKRHNKKTPKGWKPYLTARTQNRNLHTLYSIVLPINAQFWEGFFPYAPHNFLPAWVSSIWCVCCVHRSTLFQGSLSKHKLTSKPPFVRLIPLWRLYDPSNMIVQLQTLDTKTSLCIPFHLLPPRKYPKLAVTYAYLTLPIHQISKSVSTSEIFFVVVLFLQCPFPLGLEVNSLESSMGRYDCLQDVFLKFSSW